MTTGLRWGLTVALLSLVAAYVVAPRPAIGAAVTGMLALILVVSRVK